MSVSYTKRKDGRYCRQVVVGHKDGRPVRKNIYAKTIKELDKKYREYMDLSEKGYLGEASGITVDDLARQWIDAVKKNRVRQQTYDGYERELRLLSRHLGSYYVQNITLLDLEKLQERLVASGEETKFNRILAILKPVLAYGVRKKVIVVNVAQGYTALPTQKKVKRPLTEAELVALFQADFTLRERAVVYTLLYTGIRRSELYALNKSDVDLLSDMLTVSKTLVSVKVPNNRVQEFAKTDAGNRKIFIPPPLHEILAEYTKTSSGEILFPNRAGRHMYQASMQIEWKRICNKIFPDRDVPKDFTYHLFRHNYASDLYKSGVMTASIKAAQLLLGHKDIRTTLNLYTHFNIEEFDRKMLMDYYASEDRTR